LASLGLDSIQSANTYDRTNDALSYPQGLLTINILLAISWALVMTIFTQYERLVTYTKNKQ